MKIQKVISHPVHLVDTDGQLSPTALIPFCSVSNDYSAMGVKLQNFDVPVCTAFRPKYFNDQLCYSVDLNQIKETTKIKNKISFSFFIDFNEDRQISDTFQEQQETKDIVYIESIGNKS